MNALLFLTALGVASLLAFTPAIRDASMWRATVTPLASTMGSGFLVSAPLVAHAVGVWAPVAMGALLLVAYGIGAMLRFNIRYAELPLGEGAEDEHRLHSGHRDGSDGHWADRPEVFAGHVEKASHVVLVGAYVVSVSYYLQLLAAFVLDRVGMSGALEARAFTTVVLLGISGVGVVWGLAALEKLETYAVSLNLGMIASLLLGLMLYDGQLAMAGTLALPELQPASDPLHGARVLMGLLIMVQGFETSRFLGREHSAEERVRTMRYAQWTSSVVYLLFVTLALPLLSADLEADVTAVITLVAPVAAVLPMGIVVAAIGSQFSASVADEAGCAGLLDTVIAGRMPARWAYGGIGAAAIGVTWLTDALSVISLASRAFALFYALQCGVTALTAWGREDVDGRWPHLVGGVVFGVVALAVAVLGIPAE